MVTDGSGFPDFVLVTGNLNKVREAERILGRSVLHEPVDLPEIQSLDIEEVLEVKAREAYGLLKRPVVVEETGLFLDAMNGFPGALVKWMLDAMGPRGIAEACQGLGNMGAQARCALGYFDGSEFRSAVGETRGRLSTEPRGTEGFGWDPVFVPDGMAKSYAELSAAEKDELGHRGHAWRLFSALWTP